jgi:hypothetical protein
MTDAPPAYDVCEAPGCEQPVATADPRAEVREMNLGGGEYCSLGCRLDAEDSE